MMARSQQPPRDPAEMLERLKRLCSDEDSFERLQLSSTAISCRYVDCYFVVLSRIDLLASAIKEQRESDVSHIKTELSKSFRSFIGYTECVQNICAERGKYNLKPDLQESDWITPANQAIVNRLDELAQQLRSLEDGYGMIDIEKVEQIGQEAMELILGNKATERIFEEESIRDRWKFRQRMGLDKVIQLIKV